MQIDLTQIILAVITLIFGILMRYVIPQAKSKLNTDQMELLRIAVKPLCTQLNRCTTATRDRRSWLMLWICYTSRDISLILNRWKIPPGH